MITVSVDVTKIDRKRLYAGKKGKYLDLVLIETKSSPYGDYIVKQAVTKEERQRGVSLPILGNGKNWGGGRGGRPAGGKPEDPPAGEEGKPEGASGEEDVPF